MPRNGSGTMELTYNWATDAAADVPITASRFDTQEEDIADEITNSLPRDGQAAMLGNLNFGNFRGTNLAAGTARNNAANVGQVQDNAIASGTAGGSSNAFTLTLSPAITAYATHQQFTFIANHSITGDATLNVSGLGAISIKKNVNEALAEGDITNGQEVIVVYDGTNFQIPNITGQTLTQVFLAPLFYN